MDIAAELMVDAQRARDGDHLLHGVVGITDDARAQEQTFDVVPAIKIQGKADNFLDGKPGARDIARNSIDAIQAVVDAVVRKQDLQEGNTAAIRGVTVTDPRAGGGSDSF